MSHKLFDFLNDENYRLMIDVARENHTDEDDADIAKRFAKADINAFFRICNEHELDGVVGEYLLSHGMSLSKEWQEEYDKQNSHLNFLKEKAKEICALMDADGIPMVILKNGGIMLSMIDSAVKCPMEDIDSLVRKSDFHKAHKILTDNGFTFKFRSEFEAEKLDEAYRDGSTEYYITTPNGEKMWFELAWRSVSGRWIRPDLEPDTDGFMKRSLVPEGTKVHVLSPEDNLLQVCIHTAKHSYVRAPGLRLHMDVDRIVSHSEIDWKLFVQKVKDTHVCTCTYLSLYIPSVIFKTQIPQWVLDELKPKRSDRLLNMLSKAGLAHPHSKKFGKFGFLIFQSSLYDSKKDVLKVIYPSAEWMTERYGCKGKSAFVKYTLLRFLDLVGIRKKQG